MPTPSSASAGSGAGEVPGAFRRAAERDLRVLPRHRRRDRALCLRVQAADRALRRSRGRRGAAHADPAHPPPPPARAGDPRQQARRHRQHRAALRPRGVRALRRGCGDREPLHGPRLRATLPRSRRQGRGDPVSHVQPRRGRPAGPAGRRQAALPACRDEGRARVERTRQLRAGRRRDLAGAVAGSARHRRRPGALPRAGRRRAGWRRARGGVERAEPRRRWTRHQFVAGDSLRVQRRRLRRSRRERRARLRDEINLYR